jgi:hypothetical protein
LTTDIMRCEFCAGLGEFAGHTCDECGGGGFRFLVAKDEGQPAKCRPDRPLRRKPSKNYMVLASGLAAAIAVCLWLVCLTARCAYRAPTKRAPAGNDPFCNAIREVKPAFCGLAEGPVVG